jgi:hypothetical protein
MKNVSDVQRNFDLDLKFGVSGENLLLSIFDGSKKVEVKTDRMAHITGNIAVEYKWNGKPSGISTTQADYWAFLIEDNKFIIFIETEKLKTIARYWFYNGYFVYGGDDNASEMVLIPINQINNTKLYEGSI